MLSTMLIIPQGRSRPHSCFQTASVVVLNEGGQVLTLDSCEIKRPNSRLGNDKQAQETYEDSPLDCDSRDGHIYDSAGDKPERLGTEALSDRERSVRVRLD